MNLAKPSDDLSNVDLYITHIDHVGPYLKICGQINREAIFLLSKRIEQLLPTCFMIQPSWTLARQQALLTPGLFCVFKRTNGAAPGDIEYMRTRILNASIDDKQLGDQTKMRVEIEFLDYGYKRTVSSQNILFPKQPYLLQNVPILCTQFIMLGICAGWEKTELDLLNQLILNQSVKINVEHEICGQKFVKVIFKDFNLAEFLIEQKKIGASITNELMLDHCKKMWQNISQMLDSTNDNISGNNNSSYSNKSAMKTPTELAREQLAARRSLSARLELHRTIPTASQSSVNILVSEQPMKQVNAKFVEQPSASTPLANVTNMLPTAAIVQTNVQKRIMPNFNTYQHPNYQAIEQIPNEQPIPIVCNTCPPNVNVRPVNVYYNVRLNSPTQIDPQPFRAPTLNNSAPKMFMSPLAIGQRVIPAFKSSSLTVGLTYDVYVSFVNNGPHMFWVQLKSEMNDLNNMMAKIERTRLQPLSINPEVGSACVARYSDDGNCYRALISAINTNEFRVVYVDYGNSEILSLRDLYHIPEELLQIKPFSYRFALSGTKELEPIDESIKRIFKEFSLYKNFQLTVEPPESVGSMQTCRLVQEGNSMLDMLKKLKNSRQAYTTEEHLQDDDVVEIRYIDSPTNFYVQKVQNIKQFEQLMDEMFSYYNTNQKVPDRLILGAPCIVKCDQEWYRAEILRVDDSAIVVRHVDFGYEQNVQKHLIGYIDIQHLKMPRQAIKCCLKGFENNEMSHDKITDQFEMLAEESNIRRRTFTVRVFRIEPDGLNVVNLLAKNLNVMKKLYKLSMPFEQYLSLEKDQFNTSKAPSVASSIVTDIASLQLEKLNVLNSTTVESEDSMQMKKKPRSKNAEWDMYSSTSSKDTRDSQPNGNHQRQAVVSKRSQQQKLERYRYPQLDSSFESQSTSSYASGMSSPRKGNRQNRYTQGQSQSGMQNGKVDTSKNARLSNNQSPKKEQQQRQNQRSQNAPQGFAQKPQRQKSTLDGTSSSKKSTGGESDAGSNEMAVQQKPEIYVSLDKPFPILDIKTPTKEAASLSWWVSPFQFYVVPKSIAAKYENLLRQMQKFYRQKPHQPLQLKVGSSVVVHQRKDDTIMRGTVQCCNHMLRKYRVYCVDAGNLITVTSEDVWQVEQRFAEPPCLAYRCSFHSVITNYDHLYIVDRMDTFVPANAKVECEFLEQQRIRNNTYDVNMFVNGASLKELLVKADFLKDVPPEVRVELLAGQQVRGKFTSIRDMTNFKIQLECSNTVSFLCSYDDVKFVKANMDLSKAFKDYYNGKSYAFNVKNVCDNNIIHLRPIMPLFKDDRAAFICPYPIILSSFKATVVCIAKSFRIYVHPSYIKCAMNELLDDMYEYYKNNGKPLTKFEKDQICAAHSADENWYRARIISKDANSSLIEVFYIDYGNTEKLSREQIKGLEEKFYVNNNSYGIEINLPFGRVINDEKLKKKLTEMLQGQLVIIKPIEVQRNHIIADVILTNNENVVDTVKAEKLSSGRDIEYMRKQLDKEKPNVFEYIETVDLTTDDDEEKKKPHSSKSISAKMSPKAEKQQQKTEEKCKKPPQNVMPLALQPESVDKLPPPVKPVAETKTTNGSIEPEIALQATLPPVKSLDQTEEAVAAQSPPNPFKHMATAVLSHCDNPAQFYVHPINKLDGLHKLQENLQIVSPALPQLMNVVDGAHCISLYSVDKQWYRAKIIDAELMVLKFIDFGNSDCVSDTTDVKESMWSHIEPFCLPCALPISPKGTADWVDAANGLFNDSYSKVLHYEQLTNGDCDTRSYVNLYVEGVDVAMRLIADGFAKPLEYVPTGTTCFVSHVNSISDFYIQLEKDCKLLECIETVLKDAESSLKPLMAFVKSTMVAALFEEDGLWYRAELLKALPDGRFEVRFIDYGNTSITSNCLMLPEELTMQSLSKKCSLQLPSDYVCWSDEAEAKFAEITGEGELVFSIKLLKPCDNYVKIDLLVDEDSIIDKLLPLCPRKQAEQFKMPKKPPQAAESCTQIKAVVTHVNSPSNIFLQFEKDSMLIEGISDKLNNSTLQPLSSDDIKLGDIYVAKFTNDNEFYRARILEKLTEADPKQEYRVMFIDYGSLTIADDLYALPAELVDIPPLAEQHTLEHCVNFGKYGLLATEALDALVDSCNGEVSVEFVDNTVKPPVVRLTTIDKNALNIFERLKKMLEAELKHSTNNKSNTECVISHGSSPKSFYVQLKKDSGELDLIAKNLQNITASHLIELHDPQVNMNGICYSQEDDRYYRCCINKVLANNKGYNVFLVDDGNTILTNAVYQFPIEICKIPPLALHCKLGNIPNDVDDARLEKAFATLLENHFGEVYEIVSLTKEEKNAPHTVQMRINYKDFGKELANLVAGIEEPVVAELHKCIIVQYDGPTSFYVQLDNDIAKLEQMTDKLLDAEQNFDPLSNLKRGLLCAAQFPEDEVFYRARIVEVLGNGKCEVHFIDFGNNAVTENFRQLPEEMAKPMRLAKHCALENAMIAKCDVAKLQAFINSRFSETFQIEILASNSDTDIHVVRLFYQNTSICDKLRLHDI